MDKLPSNARVVFLSGDTTGIDQITKILAREKDIQVLRIFSHGAPGQVVLNGEVIDSRTLARYRETFRSWACAFAPDADILLYGCNVAQKASGEAFVHELGALTGADVAASTNRTGGIENEWALEYASGEIEAAGINVPGYSYYLATLTVTSNADDGSAGTLRKTITDASTDDEIVFNLGSGDETITLTSGELNIAKNLTIDGDNTGGSGTDITIDGNNSSRIFNITSGIVTLSNMTIRNGRSTDRGGGIWNSATLNIDRCTVSGNTVSNISGNAIGGGIYNAGSLTISNSTISGNTAGGGVTWNAGGGGILNGGGFLKLYNSTVSGNHAAGTGSSYGGGIYSSSDSADSVISNCTISGNSIATGFGAGAGFFQTNGEFQIRNSIIAQNEDNASVYDYFYMWGTFTDQGYNVVEYANNNYASWTGNGTFVYTNKGSGTAWYQYDGISWNKQTDASLSLSSTLANNGGPTQTLALCKTGDTDAGCSGTTENSFAIDAIPSDSGQCGGSAPYNIDQRGIDRPYNSVCDIGAYERTGSTLVELTSFTAEEFQDRIVLVWETASEIDTAGFYVWRRTGSQGEYTSITNVLIPAEGGPAWGAAYTHEDTDVVPGKRYYYKLEDIDASGASTFHGPVSAWPGVVNIAVNGADGPAKVPAADPVSVKVSVRPEEGAKGAREWWLCCDTPFGWFSYVNPNGWVPGIQPAWVNPQVPIDNLEVLNAPLPKGDYHFHFALDSRVDGRAPSPISDGQAQSLDRLLLNGEYTPGLGFERFTRWQTAVPDWIDSVEITVE